MSSITLSFIQKAQLQYREDGRLLENEKRSVNNVTWAPQVSIAFHIRYQLCYNVS